MEVGWVGSRQLMMGLRVGEEKERARIQKANVSARLFGMAVDEKMGMSHTTGGEMV